MLFISLFKSNLINCYLTLEAKQTFYNSYILPIILAILMGMTNRTTAIIKIIIGMIVFISGRCVYVPIELC